MRIRNIAGGAAVALLALTAAPAAFAQITTGGVGGRVTNDAGQPVAGATVTVVHTPTGSKSTTVTDGQGNFAVINLRVGGPYHVGVAAKGYGDQSVDVASISIGDPTAADVVLHAGTAVTEIVVVGTPRSKDSMGPSTKVNQEALQTLPSLSRDIRDFARTSPYAVLDPTNSNAMIIMGQNSRSNTITIDGVRQSDDFGLNANG
jgi:L-2-hydroxyglutarate oxidase LhgO